MFYDVGPLPQLWTRNCVLIWFYGFVVIRNIPNLIGSDVSCLKFQIIRSFALVHPFWGFRLLSKFSWKTAGSSQSSCLMFLGLTRPPAPEKRLSVGYQVDFSLQTNAWKCSHKSPCRSIIISRVAWIYSAQIMGRSFWGKIWK